MNDTERAQWIDNDEGLYNWQRRSGLSKRKFIQKYRAELDQVINNVNTGKQPAHYLAYQHGIDCKCAHCRKPGIRIG